MAVSSLNKEVATRLFRMLASDEQALTSVKHDHASYAKLSLLTQQAKLLKGQAVEIVNRAVTVQMENTGEAGEGQPCTAVSTEQNDGVGLIMGMLAVNNRTIATIRRDRSACAKLSLLADQVGLLQAQATQCMDEAELNRHLSEIAARTTCRLVPGTVYYHYTQNGHDALSRIGEHEWSNYETYHGKYLYDYDYAFRRMKEESEQEHAAPVALLPCAVEMTPAAAVDERVCGRASARRGQNQREPLPFPLVDVEACAPRPVCSVLSRW